MKFTLSLTAMVLISFSIGAPKEPSLSLVEAVKIASDYLTKVDPEGDLVIADVNFSGSDGAQGVWYMYLAKKGQIALGKDRDYEGGITVKMDRTVYARKVVLPDPKPRKKP